MKRAIITIIIFLLLIGFCYSAPLNLNQILESACRVNVGGAYGSGVVVSKDNAYYYILTNAHVTGMSNSATVEFFKGGRNSGKINGTVIWRKHQSQTDIDFAVISVLITSLSKVSPRVVPLAPGDYQIKTNSYISAAGCPHARWAQAWEGYVINGSTRRIIFTPPPESGQSGSGIMVLVPDKNGEMHTRVGAVLTWRLDNGTGGAIPVSTLYAILSGQTFAPEPVPNYYTPVAEELVDNICAKCGKCKHQHALGSDGKLYCIKIQNGQRAVNKPSWVTIVRWETQCLPGGICNPFRRPSPQPIIPQQPPNTVPPILAPWPGEQPEIPDETPPESPVIPPKEKIELEKLQAEYANLQKKYEELMREKVELQKKVWDLQSELKALKDSSQNIEKIKNELAEAQKQITILQTQISEKEKDLQSKLIVIETQNKEITILQNQLKEFGVKIDNFDDKLKEVNQNLTVQVMTEKEQKETAENQRNILGGLSGLLSAGVVSLGIMLWRKAKQIVSNSNLSEIEDLKKLIQQLKQFISNTTIPDTNHPDYKPPPPAVEPLPTYNPTTPPPVYPTAPYQYVTLPKYTPRATVGLGPIYPEYPSRKYTPEEVLSAVDELARRHQDDSRLRTVPTLVRQILNDPKRPIN